MRTIYAALLAATLALCQQTPAQLLDQMDAAIKALRAQLAPPIDTTARLQAALKVGGTIDLAPNTLFEGFFAVSAPGTVLNGHGSTLHGLTTPGLWVNASNVLVREVYGGSSGSDAAIRCGANDSTQTAVAQVPVNVVFNQVVVPTFMGKRGIDWHCTGVLDHTSSRGVWDPGGQDSQALLIVNTPGPVQILGGVYQAGSEGILFGGDTMKLVGVVGPADLLVDGVEVSRPLSWMTDGVKRKTKALIEAKNARRLIIRHSTLSGAWVDANAGQDGSAIVLTPHSGGVVQDVTIEDNDIRNVGGCVQILGQEYKGIPTPSPTTRIVFQRNVCLPSKAQFGGRGILAMISGEPGDLTFANNIAPGDGTAFVNYDPGSVLTGVDQKTTRFGGPIGSLTITGNYLNAGIYGAFLAGIQGGVPSPKGATVFTLSGNTIAEASALLKKNQPTNTFVTRADFDAKFMNPAAGDYRLKQP